MLKIQQIQHFIAYFLSKTYFNIPPILITVINFEKWENDKIYLSEHNVSHETVL